MRLRSEPHVAIAVSIIVASTGMKLWRAMDFRLVDEWEWLERTAIQPDNT